MPQLEFELGKKAHMPKLTVEDELCSHVQHQHSNSTESIAALNRCPARTHEHTYFHAHTVQT